MSEVTLFVRKASGLVRSWSVFDAFVYATFSINLITLGLFIFSYCWYFDGNLATAVVVGGVFTIFEVIVYASLISAMPRAGGDYVWQSRILGRGVGFLLTVTGWWFILWLWVPLYGQMLAYEILTPISALLGSSQVALWFTTYPYGPLVSMLLVCLIVFIYIAIGMKWYARVQKFSFYVGMVGLAAVFILLLFGNRESFINGLNTNIPALYGVEAGVDYYAATIAAGQEAGTLFGSVGSIAFLASFALIPMIVFFNLWPNWGSTLYGEVRGASDYKRNFWGMASAIIVTAVAGIGVLLAHQQNDGLGILYERQWCLLEQHLLRHRGTHPGMALPGAVRHLPDREPLPAVADRRGGQLLVDRLVRYGIPLIDTRDLRSSLRPHAAGVGVEDRVPDSHAGERLTVDGDPGGDHLDHVRLEYRRHADDRAGRNPGDRDYVLRDHTGGHLTALASEEHLRWLANRQISDARLAWLAGHVAVHPGRGLPAVPDVHVCYGCVQRAMGGSDCVDPGDDRGRGIAEPGQCGTSRLGGVLRDSQAVSRQYAAADHRGRAGVLRLPGLAAGRMVLGSRLSLRDRLAEQHFHAVYDLHVRSGSRDLHQLQRLPAPAGYRCR